MCREAWKSEGGDGWYSALWGLLPAAETTTSNSGQTCAEQEHGCRLWHCRCRVQSNVVDHLNEVDRRARWITVPEQRVIEGRSSEIDGLIHQIVVVHEHAHLANQRRAREHRQPRGGRNRAARIVVAEVQADRLKGGCEVHLQPAGIVTEHNEGRAVVAFEETEDLKVRANRIGKRDERGIIGDKPVALRTGCFRIEVDENRRRARCVRASQQQTERCNQMFHIFPFLSWL